MTDPADIDAAAPDTAPLPIVGGLQGLRAVEEVSEPEGSVPAGSEPARSEPARSESARSEPDDPAAPEGPGATGGPTVRTRRRPAGPGVPPDGGARRNRNGRSSGARRAGAERASSPAPAVPAAEVTEVTELEVADLFADLGDGPQPDPEPAPRPDPSSADRPGDVARTRSARRWNLPIGGPSGARAEARRAEPATLESDDPQPATAGAAVSVEAIEAVEAVEATQPARSGAPRGVAHDAQGALDGELVGTPARGRGRARTGVIGAPSRAQVAAARRLQARKVTRLVRHIDLWSLCKISIIFYLCMLVVGTVAGTILWSGLQRSGAVSNVEGFIESVFLVEDFRFEGPDMFRIGVLGGLVGVVVLTLLTVLGGLLFNLISDLVGGVRVSVVELETARPVPPRRRR
ncbi:MAG: DUF3566 domain-containing protein [Acidimicrobiia bacterium]